MKSLLLLLIVAAIYNCAAVNWQTCSLEHTQSYEANAHDGDAAYNPDEDQYLAVFINETIGTNGYITTIQAQRINTMGDFVGHVLPLFTYEQDKRIKKNPRVLYNTQNMQYLVTFEYNFIDDGTTFAIYGMILDGDARIDRSLFTVSPFDGKLGSEVEITQVYDKLVNRYVIAFSLPDLVAYEDGSDIGIVFLNSDGSINNFTVTGTVSNDSNPSICFDDSRGEFMLAWVLHFEDEGSNDIVVAILFDQELRIKQTEQALDIGSLHDGNGNLLDVQEPSCIYMNGNDVYVYVYRLVIPNTTYTGILASLLTPYNTDQRFILSDMGSVNPQDLHPELSHSKMNDMMMTFQTGDISSGVFQIRATFAVVSSNNQYGSYVQPVGQLNITDGTGDDFDSDPHIVYDSKDDQYLVIYTHNENPDIETTTYSPITSTSMGSTTTTSTSARTSTGNTPATSTSTGSTSTTTSTSTGSAPATSTSTGSAPATSTSTESTPVTSTSSTGAATDSATSTSGSATTTTDSTTTDSGTTTTDSTTTDSSSGNRREGKTFSSRFRVDKETIRKNARSIQSVVKFNHNAYAPNVALNEREARQIEIAGNEIATRQICRIPDVTTGSNEINDGKKLTSGQKAAIGIFVPLAIIGIVVGVVALVFYMKKRRSAGSYGQQVDLPDRM